MSNHKSCPRCAYVVEEQEWDGYSVGRALEILKAAPRPAVRLQMRDLDLCAIRDSVTGTESHIAHVDARRPCIAIPNGDFHILMDGNHRAAKQLRRGRPVRAYVLTREEARKVKQ